MYIDEDRCRILFYLLYKSKFKFKSIKEYKENIT